MTGDRYAGLTFQLDFQKEGIEYRVSDLTKSELYEQLEPKMNAGDLLLLDSSTMESQLLGLIWRASKIDHPSGEHDDFANAVAGAINACFKGNAATLADMAACTSPLQQRFNDFSHRDSNFEF